MNLLDLLIYSVCWSSECTFPFIYKFKLCALHWAAGICTFFLQFYEELVLGKDSGVNLAELLDKPINKKIKFSYSDDEGDNDEDKDEDEEDGLDENKTGASEAIDAKKENPADEKLGSPCLENEKSEC